jgi:hypothetical protein
MDFLNYFKPTRRNDPVFGSMLYMGDHRQYWEGKAALVPADSVVDVFVEGSAKDGMEQQHDFFRRLLQEWPELREAIGRVLLGGWHEWEPKTPIESPWDKFSVASVTIPRTSLEYADWEITFETPSHPDRLWTVYMRGRQPQHYTMDD